MRTDFKKNINTETFTKKSFFDREQAIYNKSLFYNPVSILSQVTTDILPVVQEFNESWVITNSTNFSYPHSILYIDNYVYVATRQMPARLAKININDFSDVTIITFPGTNSTSHYSLIEDMTYSKSKNKIYAPFSAYTDDGRYLKVAEINPEDLSYSIVIDETVNLVKPGWPKITTDDIHLYIVTTAGTKQVRKYLLSDFSFIANAIIPVTGTELPNSIVITKDYLYIAEVYSNAILQRLNLNTFTFDASITLPSRYLSSNITFAGNYIYVSTLTALDSSHVKGIYKVKADLSSYETIFTDTENYDIWGMLYDNKFLYAFTNESPSKMFKIDPITNEIWSKTLPASYNKINKLATDGISLFLTTYESPSKIIKMPFEQDFSNYYISNGNDEILFSVSNSTKKVEFIDTIIEGTHASIKVLKDTNKLHPGTLYKITDFQTIYNQPVTNIVMTGNTEPLIIRALSTDTFSEEAYSESFTQDTIIYDFNNTLCEDGITSRKGKIIYRKDNVLNLETGYDFRNVKFRRWAPIVNEWNNSIAYTEGRFVKWNESIWVCVKDNIGVNPGINSLEWYLFLGLKTTKFILYSNDIESTIPNFGNVLGNYNVSDITVNNEVKSVDYEDYYTFTNVSSISETSPIGFNNINIGRIEPSLILDYYGEEIFYNNIVLASGGEQFYGLDAIIENNCYNITITVSIRIAGLTLGTFSNNNIFSDMEAYLLNIKKCEFTALNDGFNNCDINPRYSLISNAHNSDLISETSMIRNVSVFRSNGNTIAYTIFPLNMINVFMTAELSEKNILNSSQVPYNTLASKEIYNDLTLGLKMRYYDNNIINIVDIDS